LLLGVLSIVSLAFADDGPSFGTDVSIAYGAGTLLGAWTESGVHGFVTGRVDAFAVDRNEPGPRIGASIWASQVVFPQQYAYEAGYGRFQFRYSEYGVLVLLRDDPARAVGYDFGFGFGRIDLPDYYGGPHALPTLTFETGPRVAAGGIAFVDVLARAQWATARGPSDGLDEWWAVSLQVALGAHAR
jgi:hypothetical protein